jgi:predicted transcriptional regulator
MSTTTVRLDDDDELILDKLAPTYGGRSNAIRQALRHLSAELDRHQALGDLLTDWHEEAGPIDEGRVEAMAQRYGL